MKTMNLNTNLDTPTTPNGDAGIICFSSDIIFE
jgi:hypothetical protein